MRSDVAAGALVELAELLVLEGALVDGDVAGERVGERDQREWGEKRGEPAVRFGALRGAQLVVDGKKIRREVNLPFLVARWIR